MQPFKFRSSIDFHLDENIPSTTQNPISTDDISLENDASFSDIDYSSLTPTDTEIISGIHRNSKKIAKSPSSGALSPSKSPKTRATRNLWKPQEDELLLQLYAKHGPKWTLIGKSIGGRTCKQVRDRYLNNLQPDINNEAFTQEEDEKLLSLYGLLGSKWKEIASQMPGRTQSQVKNRYYLSMKGPRKPSSLAVSKNASYTTISTTNGSCVELTNNFEHFNLENDPGFGFISYSQTFGFGLGPGQPKNETKPEATSQPQFNFSNFLGNQNS